MFTIFMAFMLASVASTLEIARITTHRTINYSQSAKLCSLAGGCQLYLSGDLEGLDPTDVVVKVGGKVCSILEFYSSEHMIHCEVPAPDLSADLEVAIAVSLTDGTAITISDQYPTLTYDISRTPVIYFMNPPEATPGDEVAFYAHWRTNDYNKFISATVNSRQMEMQIPEDGSNLSWSYVNMTTILGDNLHGETGPAIKLDEGYGLGHHRWIGEQADLEGNFYDFRALARIDSISKSEGGMAGGLPLVITGQGFVTDTAKISVNINGNACTVTSATTTQIGCTTGAEDTIDTGYFEGGAGLKREVWRSATMNMDFDSIGEPDEIYYVANPIIPTDEDTYVKTRLSGYFKPPTTGAYTFYIASDDNAKVFLGPDSDPANKGTEKVSMAWSFFRDYFNVQEYKFTETLTAGQLYYLEIQHQQGSGGSHFSMGVQAPGDGSKDNKMPRVQKLTIKPGELKREERLLKISKKDGTAIDAGNFVVFNNRNVTEVIVWQADGWACSDFITQFQTKLEMPSVLCEKTKVGEAYHYKITYNYAFTDARGNLELFFQGDSGTLQFEVEKTEGNSALEGTFTLSYDGTDTKTFDLGVSAYDVEYEANTKFVGLLNEVHVRGTINDDESYYYLMLPSTMTVQTFGITHEITGGVVPDSAITEPVITITDEIVPGNERFWWVVPSDFLRTSNTKTQVQVAIDGLAAVCKGDCSFEYLQQPEASSFTVSGDTVTITGTNFINEVSVTSVEIAHVDCSITSMSETEIVCTKQQGVVGSYQPIIRNTNIGVYSWDASFTDTIDYTLTIDDSTPLEGSNGGGSFLTIVGTGFWHSLEDTAKSVKVFIGDSECEVRSTSTTAIEIVTAQADGSAGTTVKVQVGVDSTWEEVTSTTLFTYNSSLDVTITDVSPAFASTIYETDITITGTNFGTTASDLEVKVGDETCLLIDDGSPNPTDTQIVCRLLGGPKGSFDVVIFRNSYGFAYHEQYPIKFEITSITNPEGSAEGGMVMEIKGNGFATDESTLQVQIHLTTLFCDVVAQPDASTIQCTVPKKPDELSLDVAYDVFVIGKLSQISDCAGTCTFTYSSSKTATLDVSGSFTPGSAVTFNGTGLGTVIGDITLTIDGVEVPVTTAADTSITFTAPYVNAAAPEVVCVVANVGKATISGTVGNSLVIASITKDISQGGSSLTFTASKLVSGSTTVVLVKDDGSTAATCSDVVIEQGSFSCTAGAYSDDEDPKGVKVTTTTDEVTCSTGTCDIAFKTANTPTMSSSTGALTISGTFIGTTATVKLGTHTCDNPTISGSDLTCTPNAPPGTHPISVEIEGYGFATGSEEITIARTATGFTNTDSSFAGGQELTITGTGLSSDATVTICGKSCESATYAGTSVVCKTPQLLTKHSWSTYKLAEDPVYLSSSDFTIISSNSNTESRAFDGNKGTSFSDTTNSVKYIGIDVGDGSIINLHTFKFMGGGSSGYHYKELQDSVLQKSSDASTWTDVHTFSGVNDQWNTWMVPSDQSVQARYLRLKTEKDTQHFYVGQIKIKGTVLIDDENTSYECAIEVAGLDTQPTQKVTYSDASTPEISSLTPTTGSSVGGTVVTIGGSKFSGTAGENQVLIDLIACVLSSESTSSLECTTGARPNYTPASLEVIVTGKGRAATKGFSFLYAERWSDKATWGGVAPPQAGESVHIPAGKNVLLDTKTNLLNLILVEGSLVVEDVPNIEIHAHYIFVNGGTFTIGTEDSPFTNEILITMYGNRASNPIPIYGNKVIANRNGIIDLHGVARTPTWTELGSTVEKGATEITLHTDVDWVAGEKIVIAPSSYDHTQAEVRTISSITGRTITLDSALTYRHYAATKTYGSKSIEVRAEVGLLSRNIKIKGEDATAESEQHGVHIMMFSPENNSLTGRVEYIELFNAGQAFSLGRYPLHFHMIGHVDKSYIKGCAIYNTFNRAVTIHGVHYLHVQNNVAYKTMGHTFFVEDGIETENVIENNLGIMTQASHSLLSTDQTPATFWITNFSNYFVGNHAAGSERYGFWFDPPDHPTGPSATTAVCPQFMPLGSFTGNVAHSNGKYGLRIFHGHIPVTNPCSSHKGSTEATRWTENPAITANYRDFTSWKNKNKGAIIDDLGDVRFDGFKVSDNGEGGIEMGWSEHSEPFNSARITNALVVGVSDNIDPDDATDRPKSNAQGIITPQTDGIFVQDIDFHHFEDGMFPIGDESKSHHGNVRDYGGRLHKLSGLTFTNSVKKFFWNTPERGIFEIQDDSLGASYNGVFIAANWPHLESADECSFVEEFNAIVCDSSVKIRRVLLFEQIPWDTFNWVPLTIRRVANPELEWSQLSMVKCKTKKDPTRAWAVPLVTGHDYEIFWGDSPHDWTRLRLEIDTFEGSEFVNLKFNVTDRREHYAVEREVDGDNSNVIDNTTVAFDSTHKAGQHSWNNATDDNHFAIHLSGLPFNSYQYGEITVTGYSCWPAEVCEKEAEIEEAGEVTTSRWSESETWGDDGFPQEGGEIFIGTNQEIIVDIVTPTLSKLEVNGILRFDPERSASLNSKLIYVRAGQILSGNSTHPTPADITHSINLHGVYNDPTLQFTSDIEPGNKALVNVGTIGLYGYPKTSWTELMANAKPGDSYIYVRNVNWQIGDEIVIAPSGFKHTEYEVFKITDVMGGVPITSDGSRRAYDFDFNSFSEWTTKKGELSVGNNDQVDTSIITTVTNVDGSEVTRLALNATIQYYHAGSDLVVDSESNVNMRAEVGLLTRNVKIHGTDEGWSCTFITTQRQDLADITNIVTRSGNTTLHNVQITNCGQKDLHRSAIRYHEVTNGLLEVKGSSISGSETRAIRIQGSTNALIQNNVVYDSRWSGIQIKSGNSVQIKDNVIIGVRNREYTALKEDLHAGILFCYDSGSCNDVYISGNRASGSVFAGYIGQPKVCGKNGQFSYNVAHSNSIGLVMASGGQRCLEASYFTAHMNELGAGAYIGATSVKVDNFKMADNLVGLALKGGMSDYDLNDITLEQTNLLVVGKTHHSGSNPNCPFSNCSKRAGFYTSVADEGAKMIKDDNIMKLPVYGCKNDGHSWGWSSWDAVKAANFISEGDYVFKTNPKSPDFTVPQFFTNFNNVNCPVDRLAYMNDPDPSWINQSDCGITNCTGPWNNLVEDQDGSMLGFKGVILPNNPGVAKEDICTQKTSYNGYVCDYTGLSDYYVVMISENTDDEDSFHRSIAPTIVSNDGITFKSEAGSGFYNNMNFFMDHVWDGFYTGQMHMSRFPSLVFTRQYYNVSYTGTIPSTMRFYLQGAQDRTRGVIVSMKYAGATSVEVYKDNKKIEPIPFSAIENKEVSFGDTHGSNRWFHGDHRVIQFILRNEEAIEVRKTNNVAVNMRIDMSIDDFYSNDGETQFINKLAAILQIPTYRIRIVDINVGSIVTELVIGADTTLTTTGDQNSELQNVQDNLNQSAESGALEEALGMNILSLSSEVNTDEESNSTNDDSSGSGDSGSDNSSSPVMPDDSEDFDSFMDDYAVAIIIGGVIITLVLVALVLYFYCSKKAKVTEVTPIPMDSPDSTVKKSDGYFTKIDIPNKDVSRDGANDLQIENLDKPKPGFKARRNSMDKQ